MKKARIPILVLADGNGYGVGGGGGGHKPAGHVERHRLGVTLHVDGQA